jgi:hypothetical protein
MQIACGLIKSKPDYGVAVSVECINSHKLGLLWKFSIVSLHYTINELKSFIPLHFWNFSSKFCTKNEDPNHFTEQFFS